MIIDKRSMTTLEILSAALSILLEKPCLSSCKQCEKYKACGNRCKLRDARIGLTMLIDKKLAEQKSRKERWKTQKS